MISQIFNKYLRSENGSAMIVVGLTIFSIVGATGLAVDISRKELAQAKLSNALDAAGLAAGSTMNSADITTEANKYINANFDGNRLGATITNLTVTPNADNTVISLSAQGTVTTTFGQLFRINTMGISATSEVTRTTRGLELVLVMDTTGSMSSSAGGGISKMEAAKVAADNLLDILFGDNETVEDLWVGMVPFAQTVNIGASRSSWTVSDTFRWGTTSWRGCVDARETGNQDVTDTVPSTTAFPKYYWPCDTNNKWYGTNSSRNNCSTSGTVRYKSGLGTTLGPNKSCTQEVTPMTAHRSTLSTAVSTLYEDGYTHINVGLAWGWRMLSPNWRGLWGGEMNTNSLPLNYDAPLMNKAVVLMTDGDNTVSDISNYGGSRTAYWYLSDGRLGTTDYSTAISTLDARTLQICNSMKAAGIIIYTVAFGTSINATSQDMLRDCATKEEYYFYSPTSGDLQNSFRTIGDSLSNLRISH